MKQKSLILTFKEKNMKNKETSSSENMNKQSSEEQNNHKEEPLSSTPENQSPEKTNSWNVVLGIVTTLAVLDYVFRVVPKFDNLGLTGFAIYFGGALPNMLVILIFWIIKKLTDKSLNKKSQIE